MPRDLAMFLAAFLLRLMIQSPMKLLKRSKRHTFRPCLYFNYLELNICIMKNQQKLNLNNRSRKKKWHCLNFPQHALQRRTKCFVFSVCIWHKAAFPLLPGLDGLRAELFSRLLLCFYFDFDFGFIIIADVNMVAEPKAHQIGRKRQNVSKTGNDW